LENGVEPFSQFYRKYRDQLFAYLLRMTNDYHLSCDLMQESFTRCLSRYGANHGSARLLYTVARNARIDAYRKREAGQIRSDEVSVDRNDPEHHMLQKESCRNVMRAMEQLRTDERELLALVASTDLSYRSIGKVVGISEGNVRVRVHRARLNLKKILESD
jgi:RNA polymerase sigma-70 factor (ECF subfamily)